MKNIISVSISTLVLIFIILACFSCGKGVSDGFQYTSDFAKYENTLNKFIKDASYRSHDEKSSNYYIQPINNDWSNGFEEIAKNQGAERIINSANFKLSNAIVTATFNKIYISKDLTTKFENYKLYFKYLGHKKIYSNIIEIGNNKIATEMI
ncbi:hypothetical protein OAO18_01410 [Francisellaceae bacterium]|nr:hypothetical protein [Francisellaceae bacterium]